MKKQVTLLLLTLLCLGLAAVPAMAETIPLWDTGGPEFPSPVGIRLNNGLVQDVSWMCLFHDCDVTGVSIYAFDTVTGGPFSMNQVSFLVSGSVPLNFRTGVSGTTTDIFQIGDCRSSPTDRWDPHSFDGLQGVGVVVSRKLHCPALQIDP